MNIEEILYQRFGCEFKGGNVIFKEGEPGATVFLIQQGKVQIRKAVAERFKVLATLGRGDFFGEMALISDKPRSATAVALEDCRLLSLSSEVFFKVLRSNYDISVKIIEQLAQRLAEADKRLDILLFTDTTTRLVRHFESLPDGPLNLDLTQTAYEIGVVQERLAKILGKFEEKGIITLEAGKITTIDQAKLDKLKKYLILKEEFGQID